MADDGGMLPGLCQHLTLTILDDSADAGLRMIKTNRYYLDTWEAFLEDRQKLVDHLHGAHHADRACTAADSASLPTAPGGARSDLASFLGAHPIQA
jgi:hypothetical protein